MTDGFRGGQGRTGYDHASEAEIAAKWNGRLLLVLVAFLVAQAVIA